MQLYRPQKNIQQEPNQDDFLAVTNAPPELAESIRQACYNCHSNYTNYQWFDNIAPISWYVDNNVQRGKFSLNFSNWGKMPHIEKEMAFNAIPFDINTDKMPKSNYLFINPEAKLSQTEKDAINVFILNTKKQFLWDAFGVK